MKSASFSLLATQIIVSPTPSNPNHCFSDRKKQKSPPLVSVFHPLKLKSRHSPRHPSFFSFSGGDEGGGEGGGGSRGSGGGGGGGSDEDEAERNKAEAIMALVEVGRSLDSIPKDLAGAIEAISSSRNLISSADCSELLILKHLLDIASSCN